MASTPDELFPERKAKKDREIAAGQYTCHCGRVYYKTTDICPHCRQPRPIELTMGKGDEHGSSN